MSVTDPVVVAIHGAGMTPAVFASLAGFARGFTIVPVALAGHGDGAPPLTSIAAMAAQVVHSLPATGDIYLAGHSMGGLVALMAAAARPDIKGCIVIGTGVRMAVNESLLTLARDNPRAAATKIGQWGVHAGHSDAENLRASMGVMAHAVDPLALYHDLAACDVFDIAAVEKLSVPLCVVAGAADKMVSVMAQKDLAALYNGDFHVIPDTGHMAMIENPAAVAGIISRFIRR